MATEKWLTAREFAQRRNVHYLTVMRWLQNEMIEGVKRVETPSGHYYLIPQSAVKGFESPQAKLRKQNGQR